MQYAVYEYSELQCGPLPQEFSVATSITYAKISLAFSHQPKTAHSFGHALRSSFSVACNTIANKRHRADLNHKKWE